MCEHIDLGGGNFAIVCGGRHRQQKCRFCRQRPATLLCDWKTGKGKTCDAPMCDRCATNVAPEKDLCPVHEKAWKEWQARNIRGAQQVLDQRQLEFGDA